MLALSGWTVTGPHFIRTNILGDVHFWCTQHDLYGVVISVYMYVCVGGGQVWIVGEGACIGQWWVVWRGQF